jgi:hypothetical protein
MRLAASVLTPLAAMLFLVGCHRATPRPAPPAASPVLAADALLPSPRLIVGRIVAVDPARAFAFVDLAADAPVNAVGAGAELMTRTADLRETARLLASRHLRGRTLGTKILSGQPSLGDEVVWLAP